jgi:hypothetical protein
MTRLRQSTRASGPRTPGRVQPAVAFTPCDTAQLGRVWPRTSGMPFPYDPDQTSQDFKALDDADADADIKAFKQK